MIRKTAAAVVVAGALALGTASATSLGTFDDISFAASSVDLDVCTVTTTSGLVALLPDIPDVSDPVPATTTLLVSTLDLSSLVAALPVSCSGTIADLVAISSGTVVGLAEGIDLTDATDYGDVSLVDELLAPVSVDIEAIDELRLVVRN